MKKIAFFMFILLVAIQAQAELCWSGVSIPFTKGNGTIEHPYLIESPEQLAFISDMVSLGVDYENTYFLQTNDFNLAQLPWTPIGTSASKPFKGIFHGGGWTISNLKIDQDNYWNYRGLFGYVIGGRLYDISVDETAIFTGKTETEYAGGIVACGKNITIVNCTNASSIACGSSCCGGIVGYLLGTSKVINCINYGKINATPSKAYSQTSYAGGIVGWVDMSCGATINFCRNEGEIYASRTYDQLIKCYAGGIVGFSEGSSYIYQCSNLKYVHAEAECTAQKFNSSSTTNAYSYAGGLIGYSYRFTISESASVGTIRSKVIAKGYQMTPTSCAGGLVGGHNSLKTTYSVINSYARGDIQATRVLRDGTGHGSSYGIGSELSFIGNSYFAGTVETEAIEADTVSNCYYNSDCGATFAGKAIAKTTAQLRSSTMAFILGNKWKQNSDTNDGYPYLTEVDKYNIVFYNENYGKVYGVHIGGYCNENDIVYLQAVPHEGYIFLQWDDGNTDNPRMVLAGTSNSYTALYKKKQYNVSVNCLHGIVEGVGTYDYGTQVTLTVIPDEYYHFVKWNDGITTPSREITLTSDTVFEAILDMDKFKISTSGANGSVTGGGTYYYGTEITLTATPNEHYHFVSWSDGVTTSTRKIIVSGDAEYTAIFAIDQFTITVSAENGSITGGGTYDYGTKITLEAIPDEHYHFVKWSDGDKKTTREVVVYSNTTYEAIFAIDQHTVSVVGKVYGTISGEGTYDYGTTITLSVHPDEHYHFVQWSDGNKNATRTLLVNKDITLSIEFSVDQYSIQGSGEHGIVSGTGTYNYGDTITLVAIPDEHYHFVKWSDGVTTASRKVEVKSAATYIAEFAIDQHLITASGQNGTVKGGGTYYYGTEITLTATPNEHYHFVSWSDGVTTSTRKIIVSGDAEYTAIFAIDQFTITVSAENGSITGGGTYDYGTKITLVAIPDEHYHFVKWSDGDTNPTKTLIITTNESISAVFAINQYEITCGGEHGMVTGGGLYDYGTQIILYAIPDENYHFVKWSDGEDSQNRSIIVTESANYLALFEADLFTIQVKSINETMGSVLGSGQYPYDSDVIITAVANNGYEFSKWSDGNKENPRSIHVSKNAQYVAMFTAKNYSVLVLSSDEEQGSVIGSGEYAYNTTITIEALPNVGYSFLQWDDGNTDNPRTILITDNVIFIAQFIHIETNINEPIINSIETCKYIKDNHLIIQRGDKYYDARGVRIN